MVKAVCKILSVAEGGWPELLFRLKTNDLEK